MWINDLMDSLRVIAKDPSAKETGLTLAARHVSKFIEEYSGDRQAGVSAVMKALREEAEANPTDEKFWMDVHEFAALPHRLQF